MKDGIESEDLLVLTIIGALLFMIGQCEGQVQADRAKHCEGTEVIDE